ncbi:hypothetical protein RHGRI_033155 [Rhododendron griersonianum]|uniref:Transmembrane protein n=1 Tax=Rhododendron griersonianum TaxID=479676 RepID=A0AAV6HYY8_9ERIC|nr:hypothetical protein RHGRI_033155 [Rhododendron griersonianum]
MDAMQLAVPVLGIVAVAAVTFYAVSFAELREKSLQDLFDSEEDDENGGGYKPYESSRERRARRKAEKQSKEP